MRISLSADGVACTTTRQKAGVALKIPAAAAIHGGSGVGVLNSPAGTVSAASTFACGRASLARDSQEGVWALTAMDMANKQNAQARTFTETSVE